VEEEYRYGHVPSILSLPSTTWPTMPVSVQPPPLIPEKYLDVPSQRLYYLSLGLLCQVPIQFAPIFSHSHHLVPQAVKVIDFTWYLASGQDGIAYCKKWLLVDFAYCTILYQLRIPRLNYTKAVVLLQIALLWFLDGIIFGGVSLNLSASSNNAASSTFSSMALTSSLCLVYSNYPAFR
jgi:nucleoporin POM152